MNHHQLIQRAVTHGVRPGTALQDALEKLHRARTNEFAFEQAYMETFVLFSDLYKQRNQLDKEVRRLRAENTELNERLKNG